MQNRQRHIGIITDFIIFVFIFAMSLCYKFYNTMRQRYDFKLKNANI